MLKKELEGLVEDQKSEIADLKNKIDELEDSIKELESEKEELQYASNLLEISDLNLMEQEILETTITILQGFRKGKGNMIEYHKFLDWCLERYKITP